MLLNGIPQIIKEEFQVVFISENETIWRNLERDAGSYIPIDYSFYNLIYQKKYFEAVHDDYTDISLVILGGGTAVCLWPLAYWRMNDAYMIGSNGLEVLPPLIVNNSLTTEARRKIFKKCINVLERVCDEMNISSYCVKEVLMKNGYSAWSQCFLENNAYVRNVSMGCFVDLSLPLDIILEKMRRTNRYSIKKAKSLWKSKIITKNDDVDTINSTFRQFRKLHTEVAGRETRSKDTWDIQCEALKNSDDFVILLYNKENELIGASLYSTTNTNVTYSVAAYKRELFKQPVGHISQWLAIEYAKKLNKQWYYIGQRPYSNDFPKPTDKEIAIGHFKEGFATNFYPTIYSVCEIKKE